MSQTWISWFDRIGQEHNDQVGKKCANLGEMTKIGLRVPPGFALSLEAYRDFMSDSGAAEEIKAYLDKAEYDFEKIQNLNEASEAADEFVYSPEATVFNAGFSELKKINKIRARGDDDNPETLEMQLATMDNLKRALRKAEDEEINKFGSLLPFLATTGSATPFIGLFGTVWGIMVSFHDIGQRGSASLAVVVNLRWSTTPTLDARPVLRAQV